MYIKTEIQRTKIIEEGDNIKKIKRGTKTKERDIKGSREKTINIEREEIMAKNSFVKFCFGER